MWASFCAPRCRKISCQILVAVQCGGPRFNGEKMSAWGNCVVTRPQNLTNMGRDYLGIVIQVSMLKLRLQPGFCVRSFFWAPFEGWLKEITRRKDTCLVLFVTLVTLVERGRFSSGKQWRSTTNPCSGFLLDTLLTVGLREGKRALHLGPHECTSVDRY